METSTTSLFELQVDHEASIYLKEAARWAKFLAILGFIWCGVFILIGFSAGSIRTFTTYKNVETEYETGYRAGYTIVYIIMALLYFFPCLYTFNFAAKVQNALRNNDQHLLNQSFRNLKASYRFLGILAIIGLCLVTLALIVLVIRFGAR
jgi:hypothetical protein